MIPLALLAWCIIGFCIAHHEATHGWGARIHPPLLRRITLLLLEGPLWLVLSLGWWYINRPRPDRD